MTLLRVSSPGIESPKNLFQWLAVLSVTIVGVAVLTVLPLLVGGLSEVGTLGIQQIGWVAASDTLGIMLAAASGPLWVKRIPWRPVVSLGLVTLVAANLATLFVLDDFILLMSVRVVAGIGTGIAYVIALSSVGGHQNSERAFGLVVAAQVAYGVFSFMVLPGWIGSAGVEILFRYMLIWSVAALVFSALAFPAGGRSGSADSLRSLVGLWKAVVTVFAGLAIYYIAMGGIWAYIERIGDGAGLPVKSVGNILMIGYGLSLFGAVLCEKVVDRIGRERALVLAATVQIVTLAALLKLDVSTALTLYAVATIVYQFFWSFALPAAMAIFSGVDPSGRIVALSATAFKAGEFVGPPLMAATLVTGSFVGVISIGIVCIAVGLGLLIVASKHFVINNKAD